MARSLNEVMKSLPKARRANGTAQRKAANAKRA